MTSEPAPARDKREVAPGRGVYIGRLFGIRFYLDYSWFLIAALVVWALSASLFPTILPDRPTVIYFVMGTAGALLFFLSILLHELGHSLVSQRCGIPVPRITLLFIGGLAEISREPDRARDELKIALGGPAVTVVLILLYAAGRFAFGAADMREPALVLQWLAEVNLVLLVFNAIPGYPLDGGRVLRAILWARSGNLRKATYITSRIGVAFSWFLMAVGVLLLFKGYLNAFILLLIGIFLKGAAESGYMQAVYTEVLHGVRVRDVMSPDPLWIPAHTPLNLAVDDFFLVNHHVAFPVCDADGTFRGLLKLANLKTIEREKWPYTAVGDVIAGTGNLFIDGATPASKAMRRLLMPGEGRLAVVEGDALAGIVTRADILKFIRIHTELEG